MAYTSASILRRSLGPYPNVKQFNSSPYDPGASLVAASTLECEKNEFVYKPFMNSISHSPSSLLDLILASSQN